jgi:hypothetical protein
MPTVNFTTDINGANNPISSGNSRAFNFTLNGKYTIGDGIFSMKRGSSSSDGVTAKIFSGLNGSGSELLSLFVPYTSFSTTFSNVTFNFNYELIAGQYSLILSTNDNSGGSTQYSIKTDSFKTINIATGDNIQLFDSSGNNLISTQKLKFGSSIPGSLKLNNISVNRVYLGDTVVWALV